MGYKNIFYASRLGLQKQTESVGYKNTQREIRLQKHTESVGYKNILGYKKNNPVTKTGLQKKFHAPPYPVAQ